MNKVLGIVGMCGSGKSVATKYFEDNGWKSIYFGGVTIEEVKKEGLEVNENNERYMREKLRKEFGAAAYAIKLAPSIQEGLKNSNIVLDGLYSWQEYCYLKELFNEAFTVLAIITDKSKRYNRLANRTIRPLSSMEASNRDVAEIENLAKGGPIAIADYYIINNGTEEDFYRQLHTIIRKL